MSAYAIYRLALPTSFRGIYRVNYANDSRDFIALEAREIHE